MAESVRVVTYNIRKGQGASGRERHDVTGVGRALAAEQCDLVLCQEVFHDHHHAAAQSRELSSATGLASYYMPNKHRRIGHHGNATLTSHPVDRVENFDISTNPVERRGVLYTRLNVRGRPLHVFNVHLSLSHRQRIKQLRRIVSIVASIAPRHEAVLLAGDFNDWRQRLDRAIVNDLGFTNAFGGTRGKHLRTWHARKPMLNLDRVYTRNVEPHCARRLAGDPWDALSDHLPLAVELHVG